MHRSTALPLPLGPAAAARLAGLLAAASLLLLAGCADPEGRVIEAHAEELPDAAALATEQARRDSAAAWEARIAARVQRPDSIRGLYVNAWAAGSRARMASLLEIARRTEINAFVIDIKESDTYLTYGDSRIELARAIGAHQRPASQWLPELLDSLRAENIYPIARIVVFKDHMLAEKRPDLAIRHRDGGVWKDQRGKPWVDPYNRVVWDFNVDIAREALEMGFSEIQWDYVRFPDVTATLQRTMSFPAADGRSRAENIRDFVAYSRERLAEYRPAITADVFGLVTHVANDLGIGQQWELLMPEVEALLPMVYPSHYYAGSYGFSRPVERPYEIVRMALTDAAERTEHLRSTGVTVGEVVPWLEAMTATWLSPVVRYGPEHLRAQIQATYDAGLKSWVLWNPGSRFDVFLPALRPADGSPSRVERDGWRPPTFTLPRQRLSTVIRERDREAARALRAAQAATDSLTAVGASASEVAEEGA
jgi:hypothetical protein